MKIDGAIQADLKRLWAHTFGDSREYIDLVFGAYFTAQSAFYIYAGDTLASALLSVPYTFRYTDVNGGESLVKTRYLCGLATQPHYRGRGFISRLMDDARNAAEAEGCAFMTLIPASASLRRFYASKGWLDALPRCEVKIESQTPLNVISGDDTYRFVNVREWLDSRGGDDRQSERLTELYDFFIEPRRDDLRPRLSILHTLADFRTIIAENALSGGSVIVALDGRGRIAGLAFFSTADSTGESGERGVPYTRIPYIRMANAGVMREFMKFAYLRTSGHLIVNTPFSAAERSMLISLSFVARVKPYGMLMPLSTSTSFTFASPSNCTRSSGSACLSSASESASASTCSAPSSIFTSSSVSSIDISPSASFALMLD